MISMISSPIGQNRFTVDVKATSFNSIYLTDITRRCERNGKRAKPRAVSSGDKLIKWVTSH